MKRDDIVKRLRAWHKPGETIAGDVQLYLDAADEIERLRKKVRKEQESADGFLLAAQALSSGCDR